MSTAVISTAIFTCPGRAGPGRFLGLTVFKRCVYGHSNYQIGPNRRYPVPNRGHIVKYLLRTLSERSDLVQISNADFVRPFWAFLFFDADIQRIEF